MRTVTVVTADGAGSMEHHGRRLAAALGGPELRSDVAEASAQRFGIPAASPAAARALAADARFVARLRRETAPSARLHFTGHHLARYGPPSGRPYIVTVHDLIRHDDAAPGGPAPYIEPLTRRDRLMLAADRAGIRRAAACIAVSRHTRNRLVHDLGIPAERIHVVYPGIDHDRLTPAQRRPFAARYVLFVGSEHPRKNLPTLVRAIAEVRRDPGLQDVRLVKIGSPGNPPEAFRPRTRAAVRAAGIEDAVVFTGRVDDDALARWYAGAECLVLPSRAEGFGLPPVEAMACGCPVVAADAGVLPETTGGAALLVAPDDARALASTLRGLLENPALAAHMRERGLRHAARFTWAAAARSTRAVYASVWPDARRPALGGRSRGPRRRRGATPDRASGGRPRTTS